jgi:hypothetical protein
LLDDSWLGDIHNENRPYWILQYYLDVLLSKNRDTLYQYEKIFIDAYNDPQMHWELGEWYASYDAVCQDSLFFTQTSILVGGFITQDLWITNTIRLENGYKFTVKLFDIDPNTERKYYFNKYTSKIPIDRSLFDIILIRDGKYIDMYLDTLDTYLARYVQVDKTIVNEVTTLIKTNTCDLSKITSWPRRVDGGMDYPQPDMSSYRATHITTDRLRLRKAPDVSAQTVTTLEKGAEVQVLETGEEAVIDGIRAPWFKVLDGTAGYKGWCFSGYLREIKRAVSEPGVMEPAAAVSIAGETESTEPEAIEQPAAGFPITMVLAVTGIALAVGLVVVFLLRRKR